jgi:hypothetical protein
MFLIAVFRTFGIENKYRIVGRWNYLGIYDRSYPHRIVLENSGKQLGRKVKWDGMARIIHHRSFDEL